MAVVAAAIIALASRPDSRGPVQEHLLAGDLIPNEPEEPSITLECYDNGRVGLIRRGVDAVADDGAVSLAVTVKGTDVMIEERLTLGKGDIAPCRAVFFLKFLKPGRYHMRYNSQKTGLFAAFPFHVRPGLTTTKVLNQ